MSVEICIRARRWPGQVIRIIVIIVIIAAVARWEPGDVLALIAGTGLGCCLLADQPATGMVAP
jgi:hypothetical protein